MAKPTSEAAWLGAFAAIVWTFPIVALFALLYRFPIPFAGYMTGPAAVPPAMLAVLFYGALGGVFVQLLAGLGAGVAAWWWARPNRSRSNRYAVALAALAAVPGVLLLAVLDHLIGPW
ncbi:hypothetical protein [Phycisphaera mikurensis]|uniref:hypothetical protein n=1 Tax=Phycisphaera mikurensis TaxID=547188 RepID=UPI00059C13C9|nr:hypothetical protein [Phycisphaera mikurensis]MBB6440458.1 Fe2+ transport system protein B [Phycisphaera mikurensis]MBB6441121.1 Fe2+ transport system protein B [Phycisphaera mikurensis]